MNKTSLPSTEALKNLLDQIPDFAQTIVDWNQCLSGRVSPEAWMNTLISAEDMLQDILEYFCICSGTPADFRPGEFEELGDILLVHTWNTLLDADLQLGMDRQGFFLQMEIGHQENIPLMTDDFWRQWLALADLGNFSFEQNEGLNQDVQDEHPSLFGVPTGNLFTLMRNFIAYEMQNGKTIELGFLRLEWPFDQWSVKDVIHKGAIAVARINALNQRLSRVQQ